MKTEKGQRSQSMMCIFIAAIIWGTIGIFVDRLSDFGLSSMEIVFLRTLTAAIALVLYVVFADRKSLRFHLRDVWIVIGTGVVSFVFFNFCYFTCIKLASLPVAAALMYSAPVFVVLLSAVLFREKITLQKGAAVLVTVSGCLVLSGIFSQQGGVSVAGMLIGLATGFLYGLYGIFGQLGIRRGYSSLTITTYTFIFAAAASAFFVNPVHVFQTAAHGEIILWAVAFGVFGTVLPYLIYMLGLRHTPASAAVIIATIEPVVAAVIGFGFFHAELTVSKLIGILLILSAVLLLNINFKNK